MAAAAQHVCKYDEAEGFAAFMALPTDLGGAVLSFAPIRRICMLAGTNRWFHLVARKAMRHERSLIVIPRNGHCPVQFAHGHVDPRAIGKWIHFFSKLCPKVHQFALQHPTETYGYTDLIFEPYSKCFSALVASKYGPHLRSLSLVFKPGAVELDSEALKHLRAKTSLPNLRFVKFTVYASTLRAIQVLSKFPHIHQSEFRMHLRPERNSDLAKPIIFSDIPGMKTIKRIYVQFIDLYIRTNLFALPQRERFQHNLISLVKALPRQKLDYLKIRLEEFHSQKLLTTLHLLYPHRTSVVSHAIFQTVTVAPMDYTPDQRLQNLLHINDPMRWPHWEQMLCTATACLYLPEKTLEDIVPIVKGLVRRMASNEKTSRSQKRRSSLPVLQ